MFGHLLVALLRAFFYLLYHQFAWTYDWVAATVSLGRWNDWLLTTLPYIHKGKVLELGHGPGHLQVALHNLGICSMGIDESRQMGKLALSRLKKVGFNPLLARSYAQFLPFPDASVNQVVATFPTDYITAPATLPEIYRVLVPGGNFVILPAAWITGSNWLDRLAAWLFQITGQAPDLSEHMEKQFVDPLENAGFRIQVDYHNIKSSQVLIILAEKAQIVL